MLSFALKIGKNIFFVFLFSMAILFRFVKRKRTYSDTVLLIRLDALGDFVLFLHVARQIREHYKDKKIIFACNHEWLELVRHYPFWDEVWGIEKKRYLKNIFHFSSLRFEKIVQPTNSRLFLEDLLVFVSDAKEKIGAYGDFSNQSALGMWISRHFYAKLFDLNSKKTELEKNHRFVELLMDSSFPLTMESYYPPALISTKNKMPREYFVIVPGAGSPMRCWPVTFFAQLTNQIISETSWIPVILGTPSEKKICDELFDLIAHPQKYSFAGKTNLAEYFELIRKARLVISNETSSSHIAAYLGVSNVCILGGGHFERFLPYPSTIEKKHSPITVYHKMECFNCNWKCIYKRENECAPCIKNILPKKIFHVLSNFLHSKINF